MEQLGPALLALAAATLGSLGGIGGAILLVPLLVVTGTSAAEAAPLGLLMVAAASIAAGPRQLRERAVNHRLGMASELLASTGAVVGALVSGALSDRLLSYVLAAVAVGAAVAGSFRSGLRNPPDPACGPGDVGERVGGLAGAYPLGNGVVPYRPARLRGGLALMGLAGVVAGGSGASGGFIKTPALSELMRVPSRVAAATTTFTVGITASAALCIFALQGRIDVELAPGVIVASLLGGGVGARLQSRVAPAMIRRLLGVLLVVVALLLVVRA
ncbi:MAG: sulfite exporter TauE/SafE family protein [Acidimicrobiales bacterium]|nr:sulfite exporter TauE/SafE family protein [Acidimicrobiales bacterium]